MNVLDFERELVPVDSARKGDSVAQVPGSTTQTTRSLPHRVRLWMTAIVIVSLLVTGLGLVTGASPATAAVSHRLESGQKMLAGGQRDSTNGQYTLRMQGDGNLVLFRYPISYSNVLWASGTYGHPGAWVEMQTDGNLVIYPKVPGSALWHSKTHGNSGAGAYLAVQTDGNLAIWTARQVGGIKANSVIWVANRSQTGGAAYGSGLRKECSEVTVVPKDLSLVGDFLANHTNFLKHCVEAYVWWNGNTAGQHWIKNPPDCELGLPIQLLFSWYGVTYDCDNRKAGGSWDSEKQGYVSWTWVQLRQTVSGPFPYQVMTNCRHLGIITKPNGDTRPDYWEEPWKHGAPACY